MLFLCSTRLVALFAALCAGSLSALQAEAPGTKGTGCPPYPVPGMHFDANPIVIAIDTNHDGRMTRKEWLAAGAPEPAWQSFMKKDPHHPPYITRKEFEMEKPPDGIDSNCDGKITIEEFRQFAAAHGPAPPGDTTGKGPGPGK